MTREEIFSRCTSLKEFVDTHPDALQLFNALLEREMGGTFVKYLKDANGEVLKTFFSEIARADLERLSLHRKVLLEHLSGKEERKLSLEDVEPVVQEGPSRGNESSGKASLQKGEWACAVLAGGSGTRFFAALSDDSPYKKVKAKGLFPITPVAEHSFLELFCGELLENAISSGVFPPWVVMVSRVTHHDVEDFIAQEPWGLPRDCVLLIHQAEHPRLDHEGDPVADEEGYLIWSGDGHGGLYLAMLKKGDGGFSSLERLKNWGVRYLVLHNVDNALARPLDPARLGFHVDGNYMLTFSCTGRRDVSEKMGVVVYLKSKGRYEVMEYSVAEPEIYEARRNGSKELLFNAGHINTNLVSLDAVSPRLEPTLYTGKPVKIRDQIVQTSTLEYLNQHLSRLLPPEKVGVYWVERTEFFSPTKSLTGEDSAETTKKLLSDYFRRRLEACGARVAADAVVEVTPCMGFSQERLRSSGAGKNWTVAEKARLYLGALFGPGGRQPYGPDLKVGKNASLVIKVNRPFGEIRVNPETRRVEHDPEEAGRILMGKGVEIGEGVEVVVELEGNAVVRIPDGEKFNRNIHVRVGEGESVVLTSQGPRHCNPE